MDKDKVRVFMIFIALVVALTYAQSPTSGDMCNKDILVLLDTSNSIESRYFYRDVKPFLKQLVQNTKLNVSPEGTHIAILSFSSEERTKIRVSFEKGSDALAISKSINDWLWSDLSGSQTRTDIAFKKAGEIFKNTSPLNHRADYDDVIVLFTDGDPTYPWQTISKAKILKDRGVKIVGLGIGPSLNITKLRSISSPEAAVEAKSKTDILTMIEDLVTGSCAPVIATAKTCKCPEMNLGTIYMKAGDQRTGVTWELPRPSCGGNLRTITPNATSGQTFAPGVYKVEHLYKTQNQFDIKCTLGFEVKECDCTQPGLPGVLTYLAPPGHTAIPVSWVAPQPTCFEAIRNTVLPQAKSGQLFSIGQHRIVYTYNINNQFDLSCLVNFEIIGTLCRDKGYNPATQVCCCGTVHNRIPGYNCCDQDYYQLTTHHCCSNSVVREKDVLCPRQKRR